MTRSLKEKAAAFPDLPGVYLMRSGAGEILYVGKAARIRSRVLSYFRPGGDGRPRVPFLVSRTRDLEYILTENEWEALLLENNLIKKHRPPYNILCRDDKSYCYLRLGDEPFSRPQLVRRPRPGGGRFLGPYPSGRSLKTVLSCLRRVFPFRSCSDNSFRYRSRPCLYHQTGRCGAPCAGLIGPEEYRKIILGLASVLGGRDARVRAELRRRIDAAAGRLAYEEAALWRDRLAALDELGENQVVERLSAPEADVIGFYGDGRGTAFQVLSRRRGKIGEIFSLTGKVAPDRGEALESFLLQFYETRPVPAEIILPGLPPGSRRLLAHLCARRGRKVRFLTPTRGEKKKLLEMASRNARHALGREAVDGRAGAKLRELQELLGLKNYPARIECCDASNLRGREAVASLVVFLHGEPAPGEYRRYRIKSAPGDDDCAMISEILSRRFRRLLREGGAWPDLLLVDGGRAQLHAAAKALNDLGVDYPDLAALAKERTSGKGRTRERIFRPGAGAVFLNLRPGPLAVLIRARDEAHRFAVSYHRRLRDSMDSPLRAVRGVGPVLARRLLDELGGLERVREASPGRLGEVPGVSRALALRISGALNAPSESPE